MEKRERRLQTTGSRRNEARILLAAPETAAGDGWGDRRISHGEDPRGLLELPPSLAEHPLGLVEIPLSYGESPLSYSDRPLSSGRLPLGLAEIPPSQAARHLGSEKRPSGRKKQIEEACTQAANS
jgi:hypothetical protein